MMDLDADRFLTSAQVGTLLQVTASSVNKWVAEGRIRAFRTPGGHRRIRVLDLVEFLEVHSMPMPKELDAVSKRRLLLVDDDTRQLRALARVFSRYKDRLWVATASHGIDALLNVGSFKPHLVVLDMLMPGIDGLEVCRRLKANPETKSTRVLMVSGHWGPKAEKEALVAGAQRCISKPIDPVVVLQEIGLIDEPRIETRPLRRVRAR